MRHFWWSLFGMLPAAIVLALIVKEHTWLNAILIASTVGWANSIGFVERGRGSTRRSKRNGTIGRS